MRDLRAGLGNTLAWLVGSDRQRAAWSLLLFSVTPGASRSGNAVKSAGLAVPVGKALALLDNRSLWGGVDWLAADALVGQVDHKAENVKLKDTADAATPGAAPWLFKGDKRNIRMAKPNEGVVVRGASVGPDFWRDQVFFPAAARLVAHHRPEDPPINSTQVFDPGEGDGDWQAGLHGAVWVRPWLDQFCSGATVVPGAPEPFALLLNFTKSAGDFSGWGSVHHGAGEGVLSQEAYGPLRFGAPKHRLGQTSAADVRAESIGLNAYFGDGTDARTGPKEYSPAPWQNGQRGPIVMRVEHRYDAQAKHPFLCGERDGVWKWQTWSLFKPTDPTYPTPILPEPDPTTPTPILPEGGSPPGVPTFGAPSDFPDSPFKFPQFDDPETAPGADTPEELETPSVYGHARPHPDQPRKPVTGHTGEDAFWMARYGCTAGERAAEPIVAHLIFLPELTAAGGESVKSRLAEFGTEPDGAVTWRKPALGNGSLFVAPSNVQDYQAYLTANGAMLPAAPNDVLLAVLAGKSGSTVVDGRMGLGSALAGTPFLASGFEFRLNTTPSSATPDIQLAGKNASASDSSAGRVQLLNPLALPSEALPGSPLTGQLAIDSGATNTLKWWDGSAWQSAGGGGEANTASNVGAGVGVFQTKVGVDLRFHSLVGLTGDVAIGITDVGDTIEIGGTLGWPLNAPETGAVYSFDNTTAGSNLAGMGYDADTQQGPALLDNTGATQLRVTQAGVEIPNALDVAGVTTLAGTVAMSALFTGAAGDDVAIGSVARARFTSGTTLTGMTGGVTGRVVIIENATGGNLTVSHDATSTDENRFLCPGSTDMVVPVNGSIIAEHSSIDSRWRVASIAQSGSGGGFSGSATASFGSSFTHYTTATLTHASLTETSECAFQIVDTANPEEVALMQFSYTVVSKGEGSWTIGIYTPVEAKGDYTVEFVGA